MKITIDTKEDSHEDIKKVVNLLSEILSHTQPMPNNIFENSSPAIPNLMSMFDQPQPPPPLPETKPAKKSIPDVEFY